MLATLTYTNFDKFWPWPVRVFCFCIKIEKEQGFRFENTDYEEVRRMRHDFSYASSWMRDYDPAIYEANRQPSLPSSNIENCSGRNGQSMSRIRKIKTINNGSVEMFLCCFHLETYQSAIWNVRSCIQRIQYNGCICFYNYVLRRSRTVD